MIYQTIYDKISKVLYSLNFEENNKLFLLKDRGYIFTVKLIEMKNLNKCCLEIDMMRYDDNFLCSLNYCGKRWLLDFDNTIDDDIKYLLYEIDKFISDISTNEILFKEYMNDRFDI